MRDVTGGANWTDGSQLQESMGQSGSAFSADFFSFVRQNVIDAGGQSSIELDAETLLQGAYGRDGDDLLITAPDGSTTTIIDYFDADAPAALVSADGAMLLGHTVELLAGPASPGQYAQAAAVPANPIGSISLLTGTASVQHADGTTEPLVIGSSVFEDDVIATGDGSKMSIKFIDGTALSMSANARMVMDELVYDPSATDNSMVLNLVQGSFVFVTGLVAKTGSVSATTPVATMGIRGTTPAVTIDSVTNSTTFGIVPDPDGTIGSYQIINLVTGQVLGTVSSPQFVYQLASATGQLEQLLLTAAEIGDIGLLLQDTYNTFGLPGDQQDNQDGNDGGNDQQNQDGQQGGELQDDPRLENFTTQFALLEALSELVTGEDNEFEITQLFTQQDLDTFIDTQDDEPPPTDDTGQPVVFSFSGSLTLDEDTGATLSGFSISYPGELTVAIAAGSTLTLNSTEGLTFTVGDGTNDQVMVFTGSAEAIMRALNGATYTPTEDANHGSLQMVFVDSATGKIVGAINVPITITPQPDPPIANNDVFFDIPEDAGRDGNAVFKANLFDDNGFGPDYDPDPGETPVVTQFWVDWNGDGTYDAHVVLENGVGTFESAGGRVTVHADGTIEIVPGPTYDYLSAGESKQVGLKYEIESNGDTAQAIVTGFITGQNDAPVVQDIATAVNEDGPAKTLTASFTDVDVNDSHTVTVDTTGTVGKVVNNGDGTFTYNPNGQFDHLNDGETATDTFTYTVNDGNGGTSTKTVTVTINGSDDEVIGNLGFETGNFSGWSVLGNNSVVSQIAKSANNPRGPVEDVDPTDGDFFAAIRSNASPDDAALENFLGVEAGSIADVVPGNPTTGSAIKAEIDLQVGDVVMFDWYFDAGDYDPYFDTAFYVTPDGTVHRLATIAEGTQNNDQSVNANDTGWRTMSFVVTDGEGDQIGFGVVDEGDQSEPSSLYIDNIRVVRPEDQIEGDPMVSFVGRDLPENFALGPDTDAAITNFNLTEDSIDISAIVGDFGGEINQQNASGVIEIDLIFGENDEVIGADIIVDPDGPNGPASPEYVGTIEFDQPPASQVVLNVVFQQGGDPVGVQAGEPFVGG